ncbi:transcriptional activator [Escherichia coli]|nr:PerC family transcriptional regulator [Escherichia sp. 79.0191]BDO94592.1 transcriptional activator [Escherichia coli]
MLMVHDDKAEELEAKGLWRRAANRWGELLKQAASDEARQYVTERRTACIRKATITREPERDLICAIRTAATKTLTDMGIDLKKEDPLRGIQHGHTKQEKRRK